MKHLSELTQHEVEVRYGGAEPNLALRQRVERSASLSRSERFDLTLELCREANLHRYGYLPRIERVIRVKQLSDSEASSPRSGAK